MASARNAFLPAPARRPISAWLSAQTLTEAEVRYLIGQEFARTAADVLWRRTKLGLVFSGAEAAALDRFMAAGAALQV